MVKHLLVRQNLEMAFEDENPENEDYLCNKIGQYSLAPEN